MSTQRFFSTSLLALGLTVGAGAAQATVIGATPNADFNNGSYTLNLANNTAQYTFSDTGIDSAQPPFNQFDPNARGHYKAVAIQTGGQAKFNSLFGSPAAYMTVSGGPFIGNSLLGTFTSFTDTTSIPFSNGDHFYALRLDLNDGKHYGYARVTDRTLVSFGYQSVAGQEIQAGATPTQALGNTQAPGNNTSVPEPTSWALFGFGLVLLGFGSAARSRRRA